MLSAPSLAVCQGLHVRTDLRLCHPPQLTQTYTWEHTMTGRIRGVSLNSDQGRQSAIALEKDSNSLEYFSGPHRGSANGCRLPPATQGSVCGRQCLLRESAHPRDPVERTGHYRKQARPISPQETTVPAVQRLGRCAGSNCQDASKLSGRQRMVNSSSTADANSLMETWERFHRVPSLSRVSSGSAATELLSS